MKAYPLADDLMRRLWRVRMPRAPRLVLDHLREMVRTYVMVLYAYTLMSNHVHLLLQAPKTEALGRPLRWFLTQTAKAFHKARRRRGHFWERRYHACLVQDDLYALGALRYLDWNPVHAGLVPDPSTYPWSSYATCAHGTPNPIITYHPPALSPYPAVRQRHYRTLLAPRDTPQAEARYPRWSSQALVGTPAFVARHLPRRSRRRLLRLPQQVRALGD